MLASHSTFDYSACRLLALLQRRVSRLAEEEEYDASTVAQHLRDHALFIAFAPVEAPRIAIAVVVEHGGAGSRAAAPVARATLDAWLDQEIGPELQP